MQWSFPSLTPYLSIYPGLLVQAALSIMSVHCKLVKCRLLLFSKLTRPSLMTFAMLVQRGSSSSCSVGTGSERKKEKWRKCDNIKHTVSFRGARKYLYPPPFPVQVKGLRYIRMKTLDQYHYTSNYVKIAPLIVTTRIPLQLLVK